MVVRHEAIARYVTKFHYDTMHLHSVGNRKAHKLYELSASSSEHCLYESRQSTAALLLVIAVCIIDIES
jgi:hypothetical protein